MSIYRLHQHPRDTSGADLICLADRFNWFAALLPPVWALANGLWLVLTLMVVFGAAIYGSGQMFALPLGLIYLLFVCWLGFEATAIHSRVLTKRGWKRGVDIIAADDLMAEQAYFASRMPAKELAS